MTDQKTVRPEPMFPVDAEAAPKIVLAGKEWAVVEPAVRQAREIVPAVMAIMPTLGRILDALARGGDGASMQFMASLDQETFDKIAHIVFWSIKRAHPGLGRSEFDEMPIKTTELFMALPVIINQLGFVKAQAGAPPTGEAEPAEPASQ